MGAFNIGAFLMTTGGCQNSFLYDEACFPVCSTLVAPQRPPAGSQEKAGVPGKEYVFGRRRLERASGVHFHSQTCPNAQIYMCIWLVWYFSMFAQKSTPVVTVNTHTHKLIKEKQEFRAFYVVGFRVWPWFTFVCEVQQSTESRNGSQWKR